MLTPAQLMYVSKAVRLLLLSCCQTLNLICRPDATLHLPTMIDRKMVNRQMPVQTFSNHSACCASSSTASRSTVTVRGAGSNSANRSCSDNCADAVATPTSALHIAAGRPNSPPGPATQSALCASNSTSAHSMAHHPPPYPYPYPHHTEHTPPPRTHLDANDQQDCDDQHSSSCHRVNSQHHPIGPRALNGELPGPVVQEVWSSLAQQTQ
jgi:hypothetical protein